MSSSDEQSLYLIFIKDALLFLLPLGRSSSERRVSWNDSQLERVDGWSLERMKITETHFEAHEVVKL